MESSNEQACHNNQIHEQNWMSLQLISEFVRPGVHDVIIGAQLDRKFNTAQFISCSGCTRMTHVDHYFSSIHWSHDGLDIASVDIKSEA